MSFAKLKKQSKLGSLTAKLVKEVEKMNNNGASGDDRLWKLDVDKSGNGYAVIRFLPAPDGEDLPFVKLYSHAFQGPGGWYIENSLTTLGQKDPVSEYNTQLWNNGTDSGKETADGRALSSSSLTISKPLSLSTSRSSSKDLAAPGVANTRFPALMWSLAAQWLGPPPIVTPDNARSSPFLVAFLTR